MAGGTYTATTTSTDSSSSTAALMDEDTVMQICAADNGSTAAVRVEPDTHDELMYALGVNIARQLGDVRYLVENHSELEQVAKGLLDTVIGRLNEHGQREILRKRAHELNHLISARADTLQKNFEKTGRDMLKRMAETDGVIKLDSNVVVHVLDSPGAGDDCAGEDSSSSENSKGIKPTIDSTVLIHYHGTLADGTVFDSTIGCDPVKLPLAHAIPGWRDGVLKLRTGDIAMLGIPPEQGYGYEGTPDGRIPGGSVLFFKIHLLEVVS